MIPNVRSAEQWLAEVDRVIRAYRVPERREPVSMSRQAAVKRLIELGLTEGDARRYLDGRKAPMAAGVQRRPC